MSDKTKATNNQSKTPIFLFLFHSSWTIETCIHHTSFKPNKKIQTPPKPPHSSLHIHTKIVKIHSHIHTHTCFMQKLEYLNLVSIQNPPHIFLFFSSCVAFCFHFCCLNPFAISPYTWHTHKDQTLCAIFEFICCETHPIGIVFSWYSPNPLFCTNQSLVHHLQKKSLKNYLSIHNNSNPQPKKNQSIKANAFIPRKVNVLSIWAWTNRFVSFKN